MLLRAALLTSLTVALVASSSLYGQDGPSALAPADAPLRLVPTNHPVLPTALSEYWLVSHPAAARTSAQAGRVETAVERFAKGVELIAKGDFAGGLPLVNNQALARTPLAAYSQYYAAVALMNLSRMEEARALLASDAATSAEGYLSEAIALRTADVALALDDASRAVDLLDDLVEERLLAPEDALLQLARAAERAGDRDRALEAYRQLYYEMPLSTQAEDAQAALAKLETEAPADKFEKDLRRAERLYAARRWPQARTAFEALSKAVKEDDDRALIRLRLGELDFHQNRLRASRDALVPLTSDGPRQAEARFYHLSAIKGLGDSGTFVRLARKLVEEYPDSTWAEDALNNLASHFIVNDEDDAADEAFRQMLRLFPKGRYGDRAAWRVGWRAYRAGDFRAAAEVFERGALAFPRADYRPAWLYWSGRAREQMNEPDAAAERYAVAVADYQNSYYGRLATKALTSRKGAQPSIPSGIDLPASGAAAPTDALIRELISLKLYDDALREVQYAQRKWGDSPQLQATSAFVRHHQGLTLKGDERFGAIRGAINTMRRAYPQFMASGGENLPPEVLRIIFPLDYWPLITKYSKQHSLDPYLVAALMAQESTFTPEIRSSANAIGLMQLIPSTGRRYARKLGIRNFTTNSLTNPETNVRLGTEYFKELITRFGSAHYALASYNAGENRVAAWIAERPPLPEDEFVDDIPFQETQTYVKRILGTAEDYRRLYGGGLLDPNASLSVPGSTSAAAVPAKPAAPVPAKRVSPQRNTTQKPAAKPVPKPAPKRSTPASGARRR